MGTQKWIVYKGKSIYKWMMTGGTLILAKLHMEHQNGLAVGTPNLAPSPLCDHAITGFALVQVRKLVMDCRCCLNLLHALELILDHQLHCPMSLQIRLG